MRQEEIKVILQKSKELPDLKLSMGSDSGLKFLREKLMFSQALQQQYQNKVPCTVPVFLDPKSYNGHLFANKFPQNHIVNQQITKMKQSRSWMPSANGKKEAKLNLLGKIDRRRSKYNQGTRPLNYFNQSLVAEYQRQLQEQKHRNQQQNMATHRVSSSITNMKQLDTEISFKHQPTSDQDTLHGTFYKQQQAIEANNEQREAQSPIKTLGLFLQEQITLNNYHNNRVRLNSGTTVDQIQSSDALTSQNQQNPPFDDIISRQQVGSGQSFDNALLVNRSLSKFQQNRRSQDVARFVRDSGLQNSEEEQHRASNRGMLSSECVKEESEQKEESKFKTAKQLRFRSAKQQQPTVSANRNKHQKLKRSVNLRTKSSMQAPYHAPQQARAVSHHYTKAQLDGIKTMVETGNFKSGIEAINTLMNKDLDSLGSPNAKLQLVQTISENAHHFGNKQSTNVGSLTQSNDPEREFRFHRDTNRFSNDPVTAQNELISQDQNSNNFLPQFYAHESKPDMDKSIRRPPMSSSLRQSGVPTAHKSIQKTSKMRRLLSINSQEAKSPKNIKENEAKMCESLNENKIGNKRKGKSTSTVQTGMQRLPESVGLSRHESLEQTLNHIFQPEYEQTMTQEELKHMRQQEEIQKEIAEKIQTDYEGNFTLGNEEGVAVVQNQQEIFGPQGSLNYRNSVPTITGQTILVKESEMGGNEVAQLKDADEVSNEEMLTPLADRINQRIEDVLKNVILEEEDLVDEDELHKRLFNRFIDVENQISINYHEYGYAKSPDFFFQSERVQRAKQDAWLKSRGKMHGPQQKCDKTIVQGQDRIKIKPAHKFFNSIPKADTKLYREKKGTLKDAIKYDYINDRILDFCSTLFHTWLEDYKVAAQDIQEENGTHLMHYTLNEGAIKNIQDQCLPIDYFSERMLQIGLVNRMSHLKMFIEIMLQFDNAGWTDQGPNAVRTRTPPPEHRVHNLKLFQGEQAKVADGRHALIKDDFKPMNISNKQATKFFRQNMDPHLFQITDRISLTQFLSLFNVMGPNLAKKLDRLVDVLKDKATEIKEKLPLYERILANPLTSIKLKDHEERIAKEEAKKRRAMALQKSKTMAKLRVNEARKALIQKYKQEITPQRRKMVGTLAGQLSSQQSLIDLHMDDLLAQPTPLKDNIDSADEQYYLSVLSRILSDIKQFKANERPRAASIYLEVGKALEEDSEFIESLSYDEESNQNVEEESAKSSTKHIGLMSRADQVQRQIDTIRKKTILTEVIRDIRKTQTIIKDLIKAENISPNDTMRQHKLNLKQQTYQRFLDFVIKGLKNKYMTSAGLYYNNNETLLGKSLLYGANRRMCSNPHDYGVQARTLIMRTAVLMIQHDINLTPANFVNILSKPKKPNDPPAGQAPNLMGWLMEINGDKFQNKLIASYINQTVNLVLDQMTDREDTISFPNEHAEYMIDIGQQIWKTLDVKNRLWIRRDVLDRFMMNHGIVCSSKEVNTFLRGCLSGKVVNATALISKSEFMKVIYKGVLRDAVLNIIAFTKLGADTDVFQFNGYKQRIVPFSHQIQKFQRFLLYCGIKTKNSKGVEMRELQDFYDYSEYCMEVITNLQKLKYDRRITLDYCKIQMELHKENLKKKLLHMQERNNKMNILEVPRLEIDVDENIYRERKLNQFDEIEDEEFVLTLEAAVATKDHRLKQQKINDYIRRLIQTLISVTMRPMTTYDPQSRAFWQQISQKCIGMIARLNPMHSVRYKTQKTMSMKMMERIKNNLDNMSLRELNDQKTIEFGSLRFEQRPNPLNSKITRKSLVAKQNELLQCTHNAQLTLLKEIERSKSAV